jgi:hypothetical protein
MVAKSSAYAYPEGADVVRMAMTTEYAYRGCMHREGPERNIAATGLPSLDGPRSALLSTTNKVL